MSHNFSEQENYEYDRIEVQFVVRGLQLMNGGGIIALLAFLAQMWEKSEELKSVILLSMVLMGAGLACIQLSATIRLRSTHWDRHNKKRDRWWKKWFFHHYVYINLRTVSFILFLASGAWLIRSLYSII